MKNEVIKNITCGILYNNNFSLMDKWGEIADTILYHNNNYFDSNYFPYISSQNNNEGRLFNDNNAHIFSLTAKNAIYSHRVNGEFNSELETFKKRLVEFIVPKIIEKNGLEIKRVGVVFTCEITKEIWNNFIKRYFKPEIKNIQDFRFSKREKSFEGANYKDNSNYINKIITLATNENNKPILSYDYQLHYIPIVMDIKSDVNKTVNIAFKCLNNEFEDGVNNE